MELKNITKNGVAIGSIVMFSIIMLAMAAISSNVGFSGTITGVNVVVEDVNGVPITQFAGIQLAPGETKTFDIYVKNTGYDTITLTKVVTGLPTYLTFNWNYNNEQITAGNRQLVVLSLTASGTAVPGTGFSFNVEVTGNKVG